MKHVVYTVAFLLLIGLRVPLPAIEMALGVIINNYSGSVSGFPQFKLTKETGYGFSFDLYLQHNQFVKQRLGGNIYYDTPKFGGCKAYFALGPVFQLSANQLYPGGNIKAGFYTPWKVSFHVSSTGISSQENLLSAFDYSADAALQGDLGDYLFTVKYLFNKLKANNDVYRTHSAEVTTIGFGLEQTLLLRIKLGIEMIFPESVGKLKDLSAYGQIGGSYKILQAGTFGAYADLTQCISESTPTQFAFTLDYTFDL